MTIQHDTGMTPTGSTGDDQSKPARVADTAASEASNVASTAAEGAREVAGEAQQQVKAVVGETKRQFNQLVSQTRGEFRQQAEQRNAQAATKLRTLSDQINALAQGRTEEAGPLLGYLNDAQGQLQSFATRLEARGPQGVVDDLSSFARRRSGLFLAAALGAGFVVGRVARSVAANKSEESDSTAMIGPGSGYGPGYASVYEAGYEPMAADPMSSGDTLVSPTVVGPAGPADTMVTPPPSDGEIMSEPSVLPPPVIGEPDMPGTPGTQP